MAANEEYTRGLARHLEKQCEDRLNEIKENLRKAEILKKEPPNQWAGLKNWIREEIERVNQASSQRLLECTDKEHVNELAISLKCSASLAFILAVRFDTQNGSISCMKQGTDTLVLRASVSGSDLIYIEEPDLLLPNIGALGRRILSFAADYTDNGVWSKLGE